jgi:hypothetical protein
LLAALSPPSALPAAVVSVDADVPPQAARDNAMVDARARDTAFLKFLFILLSPFLFPFAYTFCKGLQHCSENCAHPLGKRLQICMLLSKRAYFSW